MIELFLVLAALLCVALLIALCCVGDAWEKAAAKLKSGEAENVRLKAEIVRLSAAPPKPAPPAPVPPGAPPVVVIPPTVPVAPPSTPVSPAVPTRRRPAK